MSGDETKQPESEAALAQLDSLLAAVAQESPPEALVARTLAAVTSESPVDAESRVTSRLDRSPGRSWRLVAAVLLGAFLVAGVVAVQFGGKIHALFETADAEMDTVDSDL